MGNDELMCFKNAEALHGKIVVNTALEMTSDDIKFNRIEFGKRTSRKDFMNIFFRSLEICVRT